MTDRDQSNDKPLVVVNGYTDWRAVVADWDLLQDQAGENERLGRLLAPHQLVLLQTLHEMLGDLLEVNRLTTMA